MNWPRSCRSRNKPPLCAAAAARRHKPGLRAAQAVAEVNKQLAEGKFRRVVGSKVVTTVEPATDYYVAEDYHQQVILRESFNFRGMNARRDETQSRPKAQVHHLGGRLDGSAPLLALSKNTSPVTCWLQEQHRQHPGFCGRQDGSRFARGMVALSSSAAFREPLLQQL
jgi:hypothetical protein